MGSAVSTRKRILSQGLDLMSTAGFTGVTLGVLAEKTGLSKSGLFAHFGSKEEVQLGLIDRMTEAAGQVVTAPAMSVPEGLPRLKAVVANWFGWSEKAGLHGGCPAAAGVFEFDDVEGPVRDDLASAQREWLDFLAELTRKAVENKELRPNLDVEQFVWEVCGIYLGHNVSHRFSRDAKADIRAHRAFDRLLQDARIEKSADGSF